jgi:hypothetical protein
MSQAQLLEKKKWRYVYKSFGMNSLKEGALYRVEPLLCVDCEVGEYTRDLSRQQLGKHVPAAIEILLEAGCFYVVHAEEIS